MRSVMAFINSGSDRLPRNKAINARKKSLRAKFLSRVFSEFQDLELADRKILDPHGQFIHRWNKIFFFACLASLFIDPLFFYSPIVKEDQCIDLEVNLIMILAIARTVTDVLYIANIFIRFRTSYVEPPSRGFGRGELVLDSSKIARRYLRNGFCIDFIAALPFPQIMIWFFFPNLDGSMLTSVKNVLRFMVIVQYFPRLFLIFPLISQIVKATGLMTKTAWAGAVCNLLLFLLASHVVGACWYILAIEKQQDCWREVCSQSESCQSNFWNCCTVNDPERVAWFQSSNLTDMCTPSGNFYNFGIYGASVDSEIASVAFFNKYLYCLWWGLNNLSSLGQNLATTTHIGEIVFAIIMAILGLVFFSLLIGNMQTYLQSMTVRTEEWRIKRTDMEQWMSVRQLPPNLRQLVRKYSHFKWITTRGVDEEALLDKLPGDLRRDIKRHLCLELVRHVPLFDEMDERMLDAICETLKPCLYMEATFLVREGDPVKAMIFIIRGRLESYTTDGGRRGYFNSCRIGSGEFCGDELLNWALDPQPSAVLPSSTRTVRTVTEVEAFSLQAEDLRFITEQFWRLKTEHLKHKFRSHSHLWRTQAACSIQTAWHRYMKKKEAVALRSREDATTPTKPM